jgi:hypothetical protein
MSGIQVHSSPSAGLLLCSILLAATPAFAQQVIRSTEPAQSILSLVPSPRPQGTILARFPNDATFKNAPANYHVFAAATVGEDAGVEVLTLNFAGNTTLTGIQSKNKDFVVEPGGSCRVGNSYARGESCMLLVRFNPQGPGHRLGFVTIANSAEATPMSFGLTGNGYAPVVSFTPSQITTIPVTLSAGTGVIKSSTNLAIDGGDVLYIPDIGNNVIREIDSSGALNGLSPVFATPASLAADTSGFLYSANVTGSTFYFSYYAPWGSQSAYGTAHTVGSCTPSTPCPLSSVGMSKPANMTIDPYDNLFFEEGTKGAAEMPVATLAGGSGSLNLWYLTNQFVYSSGTPASFAVDANDNLYNFYNWGTTTCFIQEESLYAAEYTPVANKVAGGVACGFSGDGGQARSAEISSKLGQIAFDIAGDLYFADSGNQRVRRIEAATGIITTVAGNGTAGYTGDFGSGLNASLSSPTGVAVDSQGQVYILSNVPAAGPTQGVRKLGVNGYLNLGLELKSSTSAARVVTITNTGNDSLILSSPPLTNGANASDFAIDANTTTCMITAGATLYAGRSCKIGIVFTPSAGGNRTANLVLQDNTVTGTNIVQLLGTGTLPAPAISITSPTSTTSLTAGTAFTFAVSVTSTSAKPTGTVTFKVNGVAVGSPVALSTTGTASTAVTETTAATYTLSATYNGDANYASATASESAIVATVKVPVKISLTPVAAPALACGGVSFSVEVSSTSFGNPTGTVKLESGSSVLGSAILTNGGATLSAHAVMAGAQTFVASYSGDSLHEPATSAPVSVIVPSSGCPGGPLGSTSALK